MLFELVSMSKRRCAIVSLIRKVRSGTVAYFTFHRATRMEQDLHNDVGGCPPARSLFQINRAIIIIIIIIRVATDEKITAPHAAAPARREGEGRVAPNALLFHDAGKLHMRAWRSVQLE